MNTKAIYGAALCFGNALLLNCNSKPTKSGASSGAASENAQTNTSEVVDNEVGTTHRKASVDRSLGGRKLPIALLNAENEIRAGNDKYGVYERVWRNEWDGGGEGRPLTTEDEDMVKGRKLSKAMVAILDGDRQLTFSILANGGTIGDLSQDSVIVLSSVLMGMCVDADTASNVAALLLPYANRLPPSELDCIIVKAALDIQLLAEPIIRFPDKEFKHWSDLASAKNPAFRFFALHAFCQISCDTNAKVDFLKLFVQESDRYVALDAVKEIGKLPRLVRDPILRDFVGNGVPEDFEEITKLVRTLLENGS